MGNTILKSCMPHITVLNLFIVIALSVVAAVRFCSPFFPIPAPFPFTPPRPSPSRYAPLAVHSFCFSYSA